MNSESPRVEPKWERRKDARPAELAAAALELFVERGFAATRLEDVAARAGVSKGTLYLYFENKADLFKAVVRGSIVPAIEEAERTIASDSDTPTADLMTALMWRWWDELLSKPAGGITKLLLAEAGNFPELSDFYYEHVIRRGTDLFRRIVTRGVERGEFRSVDVDHAVHVIMAPMIMLAVSRHSVDFCGREHRDPRRVVATFLDLLMKGLHS